MQDPCSTESPVVPACARRRRLLAALGLCGAVAYVAPTLFSLGQARAGDGPEGRWRIIYDSHPEQRRRRYVDDYREHRHQRERWHRHHHPHKHGWHRHPHHRHPSYSHPSYSHPSISYPSVSYPSRW